MPHVDVGQLQLQHLVKDVEISERIGGQVLALQPDVYVQKDRLGDFWEIVIDLMKKLEKTRYHADRCAQLTKEVLATATAPSTGVQHADHTSGIEAEVEAFLFQCKATLDVLCKLLRPTANIKLATFGDKGDAVIKALQRNVAKERAPKATEIVRLVEQDQSWLTDMIALRDTVGHFHSLVSTGVRSQQLGDALIVHEPSDKNGVPFTKLVATYYYNLLTFAEDFVALTLNLAMPPMLAVMIVGETDRADLSRHKYGIGALNLNRPGISGGSIS